MLSLSLSQLRQTFLLVAFACFLREKRLSFGASLGMLAAHVRSGAGPNSAVSPHGRARRLHPLLAAFPPDFGAQPRPGKGSEEPPLPARPRPGLGPLLQPPPSPRGNERPLRCLVYLRLEGLHGSFPLEKS